ncbi:hypothetical protein [Methylobacterium sp. 37f]|uniref:hypothetical protein n=1 Tax=Methylobacterium sp. 37f TaxID=2817058 RepID=UPI001FFC772D|nr:hypothetical protein [Methylobacterium sp. 37f]MCK2055945.1 hypothetical protein [Methylobacterium sp. 37f]
MIDQTFHISRPLVSIVAIGDSGEALLLRALLESLGASVLLHLPGTPADVLLVLGAGGSPADHLVLSGHGDDEGFILGEYGPEIDTRCLTRGRLSPVTLAEHITLPGKVVVSTACETGTAAFGSAFLKGGVAAYIAPNGSPEGADAVLFVHRLFHQFLARRRPLALAFAHAAGDDAAGRMFVGYGIAAPRSDGAVPAVRPR